ncbi:hypothetical protein CVT26_007465 [Gymnopilus dilepis]|uniref:Uncharacterized protein n=1 Tax=Gymnopilus dilepis TaxID=231916 RepID=A0A409W7V5_9AGAR|nr:hypothetical protein CVT26_007465 [Gymnopilus dilepis]
MFFSFISLAIVQLLALSVKQCVADTSLKSLPYNFTLAALNTTLPNANSTGVPLVLAIDSVNIGEGIANYATSTFFSFSVNDFPTLGLVNGNLKAASTARTGLLFPNATDPTSGGKLEWLVQSINPPPIARVFSAVEVPAHKHLVLAVHGNHDLWSLCPFDDFETKIVFDVATVAKNPPSSLQFNPAKCFGVVINIVPV